MEKRVLSEELFYCLEKDFGQHSQIYLLETEIETDSHVTAVKFSQ